MVAETGEFRALSNSIERISSLSTCIFLEYLERVVGELEEDEGDKGGEFDLEKWDPLNKVEVGEELAEQQ